MSVINNCTLNINTSNPILIKDINIASTNFALHFINFILVTCQHTFRQMSQYDWINPSYLRQPDQPTQAADYEVKYHAKA